MLVQKEKTQLLQLFNRIVLLVNTVWNDRRWDVVELYTWGTYNFYRKASYICLQIEHKSLLEIASVTAS